MWSFIGIETATVPADNVINPQETIPRVLIASVLTILVIYILVSISIAAIVPAKELIDSSAPFALAATKILGISGGANNKYWSLDINSWLIKCKYAYRW